MKNFYLSKFTLVCGVLSGFLAGCEKPEIEAPAAAATAATAAAKSNDEEASLWDDGLQVFLTGLAGGATTVPLATVEAFAQPAPNLSATNREHHKIGNDGFRRDLGNPLLAPLWNDNSCVSCHVGGGRSAARANGLPQLLFRVSVPGTNPDGGPKGVPGFGDQIQPIAVDPSNPNGITTSVEGRVNITYAEEPGLLTEQQPGDGAAGSGPVSVESYSLRRPTYQPTATLPPNVKLSPRIGPQIAGLGLLEAVAEATILGFADEKDANKDGISGRPNYVWNVAERRPVLGRFGWKANQPNLLQQNAAAYNGDLGATTYYFPLESNVAGGGRNKEGGKNKDGEKVGTAHPPVAVGTDISAEELDAVTLFTKTLGVPAIRTPHDPQVLAGRSLFSKAKCSACHIPRMVTGSLPGLPELSNQTIMPFTDLLLHDMGPDLADNRPDFLASGSEWRTPPLWGLGLSQTVNGHTNLLHDGRARNVLEAILWHGGEAKASREYVKQLSPRERAALIAFVNAL